MYKRIMIVAGILLGLFLSGVWMVDIAGGQMPFIDLLTRDPVAQLADTWVYAFFRFMTDFGSSFFMYPFTVVMTIVLLILYRDWLPGFVFAGGTLLGKLANKGIKVIVERQRPSILVSANAEGFSFPSGHAMITLVAYGLLIYFLTRKIRSHTAAVVIQTGLAALIFLIGISRYVINVHYLTDVLAGFFFGGLLLAGIIFLYRWVDRLRKSDG